MKIMMITNNFTPYSGGVVSSITTLVDQLHHEGHQVQLVTLNFTGRSDDPAWVKRLYCPVRTMYKTNYIAFPWRSKAQIGKLMKAYKPDLVHVHHPFMLGVAGVHCAKKLNIPVIFTYHTVYEAYTHYFYPVPDWILKKLLSWRLQSFCNAVNAVIAPSHYIQDTVQAMSDTPVVKIPSGLLPVFIKPLYIKSHTTDKIKLLLVSRMVKEKNIVIALDAAKQLFDENVPFELTLIGYGAAYDALQAYAYDLLKLPRDVVTFIHKPSKEIISQAYHNADLFLFTSQSDTQGLVLAEAMAHSTPVIALDGPGQRDIIDQGVNGYIVPGMQEVVACVKQLRMNPELLAELDKGAYQTAQHYLPDVLVQRYIDLYERMRSMH
jgi:glycosyltransferase involved in cell wall biosynthesis